MGKLTDQERCQRALYSREKSKAGHRGVPFKLTFKVFAEVVSGNCIYCGAEPSNTLKYRGLTYIHNGIDRIDSKKGYELENVASCCRYCNGLKGYQLFKTWSDFLQSVIETNAPKTYPKLFEKRDPKRPSKSFYGGMLRRRKR